MLNFDPNRVSIGKKPVTGETSNSAHKQRKELFFTGACIIVKMKDVSSFFIVKIFDAASVQLVPTILFTFSLYYSCTLYTVYSRAHNL